MAEPMPERKPGESILDYTARVQQWQQAGGAAGTAETRPKAPTSTATTQRFPTSQENAITRREQQIAAGRGAGYAFARDLEAEGFVRLANGNYVNPRTGEEFSQIVSTAPGDPVYQKNSFGANQAERQEAAQFARGAPAAAPANQALTPLLRSEAPGGFWTTRAGFERDTQAAGGRIPGELVNLGRGLDTLRNFEREGPRTWGLNVYDPYTRGGPGRSGFTPMIGGWESRPGGASPFASVPRGMFNDSYLIEPEGYGGPSGTDFYSGGEPSVATTYGGQPATLSTGTAGAEIRGGTAGGWGGSGEILAAAGIAPSGDPLVDAARIAEIAEGFGAFNFQEGGDVRTEPEPVPEPAPDPGWQPSPGTTFAPFPDPTTTTPTTPTPTLPTLPTVGAPPPVPVPTYNYNFDPQNQDYQQRLYGYRREAAGLPQMQALQLAAGEVPTQPAPTGFYYRSFDPDAATRDLTNAQYMYERNLPYRQARIPSELALDQMSWQANLPYREARYPEELRLNTIWDALTSEFDRAPTTYNIPTAPAYNPYDPYSFLHIGGFAHGGEISVASDDPLLQRMPEDWVRRVRMLLHEVRPDLPTGAVPVMQPQAEPYRPTMQGRYLPEYRSPFRGVGRMNFAGGGTLSSSPYDAMIDEGPDGPGGRKSMVVPEPSLIVGRSGTPYGQMSEAGAELLTDTGSGLRIDPMQQQRPQQTLPDVTPQEFSYLLKAAPDVATSLAQLDLSVMRTGQAPASQMEMALGKAEGISDPNVRQRALNTYRNIVSRVNSTRTAPPDLSMPALPEDPVALAAAVKFGKIAA